MDRVHEEKALLSPEGAKRMRMADKIHEAVWFSCFEGRRSIFRALQNRQGFVEFRLPRPEQFLDFVRRYIHVRRGNMKLPGVEVVIPARGSLHANCSLLCAAPLPEEFAITED